MKPKKLNPGLLWMQFEDVLAPRLGLTVKERAVYSYLLRHSLVVGKIRLRFAVIGVARALGLSNGAAREAVRRLDELGASQGHSRARTRSLFLLPSAHAVERAVPGPCGAARAFWAQFVSQPGFLLSRMQLAQGRPPRLGFSAHALPPRTPDPRRTRRPPPRPERPSRRQAPSHVVAGL